MLPALRGRLALRGRGAAFGPLLGRGAAFGLLLGRGAAFGPLLPVLCPRSLPLDDVALRTRRSLSRLAMPSLLDAAFGPLLPVLCP